MPDDLISRSELIKTFEDARLGENSFVETVFAAGVYATIENAPAIDAVKVVRCKDCKFNLGVESGDNMRIMCTLHHRWIDKNGFCHMGAKIDGGNNGDQSI